MLKFNAEVKPQNYNKLRPQERAALRTRYIYAQKGRCYYCNNNLNAQPTEEVLSKKITWKLFPPDFTKHPIHLHHSHDTGMTIGAVHAYCNAVLWQYEGE